MSKAVTQLQEVQQGAIQTLRAENQQLNARVLQLIVERENALKTTMSMESTVSFLRSDLASRDKQIAVLTQFLQEKNQLIGQLRGQLHSVG